MKDETDPTAAVELLDAYVRERIANHSILNRMLPRAAAYVVGSVASGFWDEQSDLDLEFLLADEEHRRLAADLQAAGLWDPERDQRLRIEDHEPFRRFPGVE